MRDFHQKLRHLCAAVTVLTTCLTFSSLSAAGETTLREDPLALSEFKEMLQKKYALKQRAYRETNLQLFREFYAEDVLLLGEGVSPIRGIENVIAGYGAILPDRSDAILESKYTVISGSGDMGYDYVRFTAIKKDPSEPETIHTILLVWERVDGQWRCTTEMFVVADYDFDS